jgi:hypothetical protein
MGIDDATIVPNYKDAAQGRTSSNVCFLKDKDAMVHRFPRRTELRGERGGALPRIA